MKIGFVSIIRESWGGSEELWYEAAVELLKNNHQVVVSIFNTGSESPKLKHLKKLGATVVFRRGYIQPGLNFKQRVFKKIWFRILDTVTNPYSSFISSNPDAVVYTGGGDALANDSNFFRFLIKNKTSIIFINQGFYEYIRPFDNHQVMLLNQAFSKTALNLFVSERNKLVLERFLAERIPNARIVRNPVNLESTGIIEYPLINEEIQFAMVGNLLINHKGQDIAIAALSSEKWKKRKWHLNIYGDGIDRVYLKNLVANFGLNDRISFHGKVSDIRSIWKFNHLLLMPSRFEGIPLALVEAMICGRPVVATDVAGHTEWIEEGVEGFISGGANVNSFERAIERAWQKMHLWKEMGNKAHNRAMSQFDPQAGKTLSNLILNSIKAT